MTFSGERKKRGKGEGKIEGSRVPMRYVNMVCLYLRNDDRSFQSSHGIPNTMAKNITAGHTLLCMQQERGVGHERAERNVP